MKKTYLNIRRLLCFMLAFVAVMGWVYPTQTFAKTRSVTSQWENWKKLSYPSVKLGTNNVTVLAEDSSHENNRWRIVDFVAPKTGKYVFHFDNARSSVVDLPYVDLEFHTGMKGAKDIYYKRVDTKLNGETFTSFKLISPDWAESVMSSEYDNPEENLDLAIKSGHADYLDVTVNLKKGQVYRIKNNFTGTMDPDFHNWDATGEKVSYTLEIRRK